MLPLLPLAILALGGTAFFAGKKTERARMTPERELIFNTAMNSVSEPDKIRALAAAFRKEGLILQADALDKRAALRDLPKDVKEARREAYQKGMASTNRAAVLNLADSFDKEGAAGAAEALRKYAATLPATPAPEPTPVIAPVTATPAK